MCVSVCMWELQLVQQVYNTTGCVVDKTVEYFPVFVCTMVGSHHTHSKFQQC